LKTLEKINRKAIRNSLENGKPNSAQVSPLGPAPRTRPRPLTGGPRLSAPTRAPLLSLSPSRCSVGPTCQRCFSFARARSLSASRTPPVSPSLTSHPRPSTWTQPRLRVLWPALHALAPLDPCPTCPLPPAHLCPQSSSLTPLSPCTRDQASSATAHQGPLSFRDRC
jgi:hypothetical protein